VVLNPFPTAQAVMVVIQFLVASHQLAAAVVVQIIAQVEMVVRVAVVVKTQAQAEQLLRVVKETLVAQVE
jgi:hypothetical protein